MVDLGTKKIVIMGAGIRGKRFLQYCKAKSYDVLGFLDNDHSKWGQEINGVKCFPIDAFTEQAEEIIVVVTPERSEELLQQLQCMYPHVLGEDFVDQIGCLPENGGYTKLYPTGHYSSLYPDIRLIKEKEQFFYDEQKEILGINWNEEKQLELLHQMKAVYPNIPQWGSCHAYRARFLNGYFPAADMIGLCSLLQLLRPKRLIEVGSGWSSAVILDTNEYLLDHSIDCSFVEPYPDRLKSLLKETDQIKLLVQKLETIELDFFSTLEAGDILFIDSSHISKMGSDVNYLFFEILPRLQAGVYVHLHDITYPMEYPMAWLEKGMVFNEQYLLRAFLQYNYGWEVIFFQEMMAKKYPEECQKEWPVSLSVPDGIDGASFWMRKR